MQMVSTLALKPRADVTRSPKQGISGPTKRIYVLQIFILKKTVRQVCFPESGCDKHFLCCQVNSCPVNGDKQPER